MKKIFLALMVFVFAACNNDSDSATSADTIENKTTVIENVNGNIPDTTNTINIDGGNTGNDSTRN